MGEGSCFSTPELESQVFDPLLSGMPDIVPAPLFPSLPEVTEGCWRSLPVWKSQLSLQEQQSSSVSPSLGKLFYRDSNVPNATC